MIVAPEPPAIVQVDPDSLYRSAVADRQAGRPAAALPKLEQVLVARPDDADARLNLGLTLLALDRLDEAETALRQVTAQAPGYTDAWVALARIERRRGNLEAAQALAAQARRTAPDSAETAALERELAPGPLWRADVSVSRSRLSEGLPDWTEGRLSVSRRLDSTWVVGMAVETTRRFDDTDVYVEARADKAFGRGSGYLAVGGAPDADYRPEIGVAVGGRLDLARGLAGTLDVSAARYPTGTVTGVHPGAVVSLGEGRAELAARWINVWDETGEYRDGYGVSARWQALDRVALRVGYADAPESSDGATVDVSAWNAGLDLDLTDRLVLRLGCLSEDRSAYDRHELSAGLGWRF